MKRIFIAIKIQPDKSFLKNFIILKNSLYHEKIKWVEPENLHLTLKFFGETPDDKIPFINEALLNITQNKFIIETGELKIFGSKYQPKILWTEIKNNTPLENLYHAIHEKIKPLGYEADRQNFVPHLTLARIKNINNKDFFWKTLETFKNNFLITSLIQEFYLLESILHKHGPEYKCLYNYPLTK